MSRVGRHIWWQSYYRPWRTATNVQIIFTVKICVERGLWLTIFYMVPSIAAALCRVHLTLQWRSYPRANSNNYHVVMIFCSPCPYAPNIFHPMSVIISFQIITHTHLSILSSIIITSLLTPLLILPLSLYLVAPFLSTEIMESSPRQRWWN